ncbi:EI24 domain-containing protein [Terricaulis silvestris]|uniref:CysZ-like protein n=1 Tax=Terricaulis silvestris TaxID=2686094 RepID=A0A6I6MTC9_9CAUL|nr:EI24 domain-containing protein [Terricaulis silvestris]QGZ94393.1 CysZ-like protein [Terricaulis silvestris]
MSKVVAAIAGGLKDVFFGRLTLLALLNLVIAVTLTATAAWAIITHAVPLIPNGGGWVRYVSQGGELLASLVVVVLAIALSPAISMIVGGVLFFDIAADRVEKKIGAPKGRIVPVHQALWNNVRIALPALVLNLIAIPLYFIPVVNAIVFWSLNGFLMGREYATVVAARHMSYADAVKLRKRNGAAVFLVGLACSFIPFFAPLVGASAMTRLVQSLR